MIWNVDFDPDPERRGGHPKLRLQHAANTSIRLGDSENIAFLSVELVDGEPGKDSRRSRPLDQVPAPEFLEQLIEDSPATEEPGETGNAGMGLPFKSENSIPARAGRQCRARTVMNNVPARRAGCAMPFVATYRCV